MRAAAVYLAVNCDRDEVIREGLGKVIPRRLHKRGAKPTVRTKELAGGRNRKKKSKSETRAEEEQDNKGEKKEPEEKRTDCEHESK